MTSPSTYALRVLLKKQLGALDKVRTVFAAWTAQQPWITRGSDGYRSEPDCPLGHGLNLALEADDIAWVRRLLDEADRNYVWGKCARRNMLVAAANGEVWNYGDPRPDLVLPSPLWQLPHDPFPENWDLSRKLA